MPLPLLPTLFSVSVNLVGMLTIFSLLAYALVRLHWHGRGIFPVLLTIIMAQLFWIARFWIDPLIGIPNSLLSVPFVFSFANGLASAFAIVVLAKAVKNIPRQLEDSARLDGCGWWKIYWHVLLPLVWRELAMIGLLTLMATAFSIFAALERYVFPGLPSDDTSTGWVPWALSSVGVGMAITTLLMSLLVIAIFLLAKRFQTPVILEARHPLS